MSSGTQRARQLPDAAVAAAGAARIFISEKGKQVHDTVTAVILVDPLIILIRKCNLCQFVPDRLCNIQLKCFKCSLIAAYVKDCLLSSLHIIDDAPSNHQYCRRSIKSLYVDTN